MVGSAIAFLAFNKREFSVCFIGLIVAVAPLVMSYNIYQEKIAENAKYEARR
ncbi:hypothetical protein AVU18_gp085 [Citrobacter phage IME-CF2]|uniref:Uncharacterized protein n=1 Tax=Citrobacter phage IME-CF2 TaxID=1673887 RepID=A0A0K0QS30_9CAUD|nr:hypothetical protein AVU18_gp085 [Citrobacter phage IME-CF2]AKR15931.1 hypothetical protein [Citrobacter phage IME-CF2]